MVFFKNLLQQLPHAHLVEAVLKDMASPHSYSEAAIASVVVAASMDAGAEVGTLVVKLYETRDLEQRQQGPLQQAGIGPQQCIQQSPVLVSKPARVKSHKLLLTTGFHFDSS